MQGVGGSAGRAVGPQSIGERVAGDAVAVQREVDEQVTLARREDGGDVIRPFGLTLAQSWPAEDGPQHGSRRLVFVIVADVVTVCIADVDPGVVDGRRRRG